MSSEYDLALIRYCGSIATASMKLQMEFADRLFRAATGEHLVAVGSIISSLQFGEDVSWAFVRLTGVQFIKRSIFGPQTDDTQGKKHFLSFHPVVQEMAWCMVKRFANPVSIEIPDWPLLCYCAEAFAAIARHYNISLDSAQAEQILPGVIKALPEPED